MKAFARTLANATASTFERAPFARTLANATASTFDRAVVAAVRRAQKR
ncbi:MAG TPA: hypothetical protein VFS00_25545 [Polyangiaceae bacterium]|nr:hypothetical protein [Polyangiaceae bacterium]